MLIFIYGEIYRKEDDIHRTPPLPFSLDLTLINTTGACRQSFDDIYSPALGNVLCIFLPINMLLEISIHRRELHECAFCSSWLASLLALRPLINYPSSRAVNECYCFVIHAPSSQFPLPLHWKSRTASAKNERVKPFNVSIWSNPEKLTLCSLPPSLHPTYF